MRTPVVLLSSLSKNFVSTKWRIYKGILASPRLLRREFRAVARSAIVFFVKQSLQKDKNSSLYVEKWFIKTFKQRKTNFMSFLRPEQIIQRNWSYKIQVFKIAAKAEKDKTEKQSQRMKNNLNRCVQFSVLKYIYIYI